MKSYRKPTIQEIYILELLIKKGSLNFSHSWKKDLLVYPMDDGEMGSLYLYPLGKEKSGVSSSEFVSDYQFKDKDGVDVIASLYLDSEGDLFELDIWKTDFSKLIEIPNF